MNKTASKRKYDNEEHKNYIREHEDIPPDEDYEMHLKASDRKKLWALAAGKCSLCGRDLFLNEKSDTNIGKECHISSHKPDHPSKEFSRYNPSLTDTERDKSYDNAIILCGVCHDIIDNPKNTQYTIEELHQIKEKHEAKVKIEQENNKKAKHEDKKIRISATLLTEIKANQNLLQPISDIVDELANDCIENSGKKVTLPNRLSLNTNYFSSLSEKLELLDGDSRVKLFSYYSELGYIEEEYKKLKLIHGEICTSLVILQLKETFKHKIINPGWNEIDIFLKRTKKTYNLGEELIQDLKA